MILWEGWDPRTEQNSILLFILLYYFSIIYIAPGHTRPHFGQTPASYSLYKYSWRWRERQRRRKWYKGLKQKWVTFCIEGPIMTYYFTRCNPLPPWDTHPAKDPVEKESALPEGCGKHRIWSLNNLFLRRYPRKVAFVQGSVKTSFQGSIHVCESHQVLGFLHYRQHRQYITKTFTVTLYYMCLTKQLKLFEYQSPIHTGIYKRYCSNWKGF